MVIICHSSAIIFLLLIEIQTKVMRMIPPMVLLRVVEMRAMGCAATAALGSGHHEHLCSKIRILHRFLSLTDSSVAVAQLVHGFGRSNS
jgi:hypothetical protein